MYNNESFEIIKKWPDDQENLLLFEISVFAKPLNILAIYNLDYLH